MSRTRGRSDGSPMLDPDGETPSSRDSSAAPSAVDPDDTMSTAGSEYDKLPAGDRGAASRHEVKRYSRKQEKKQDNRLVKRLGVEFRDYADQLFLQIQAKDRDIVYKDMTYNKLVAEKAKVEKELAQEREQHLHCQADRNRLDAEVTRLTKELQEIESTRNQPAANDNTLESAHAEHSDTNKAPEEAADGPVVTNTTNVSKASKNPNKKRKVDPQKHLYLLQLCEYNSSADPSGGSPWNIRGEKQVATSATSRQLDSFIREMQIHVNLNPEQMTGDIWHQDLEIKDRVQMKYLGREAWSEWCKEVKERDDHGMREHLPLIKAYRCGKEDADAAAQFLGL